MKKFMVIYHATTTAEQNMKADPGEMQKVMLAWQQWMEDCKGAVVDMGTPLGNSVSISPNGTGSSSAGAVGYSILEAESMEAATAMLQKHPHLNMPDGCTIEVHECLPLPGM